MQGFVIVKDGRYGFSEPIGYFGNSKKCIQSYNNFIREELLDIGGNLVRKEDFSETVNSFKEHASEDTEIICRKFPLLIYKRNNNTVCNLYFWETSPSDGESDIEVVSIIIKPIEIVC